MTSFKESPLRYEERCILFISSFFAIQEFKALLYVSAHSGREI